MKYITKLKDIRQNTPSVVTLGKFDGLHRGHQKIFRRAHQLAATYDSDLCVFTFSISPQTALGQRTNTVLTTFGERKDMIEAMGTDLMVECPFNEDLRCMTPDEFVEEILVKRFKANAVIIGRDFRFGKDRKGDAAVLSQCARRYGFYVESVEKEKDGDRDISSTYIREEIEAGHMEKAADLLGYPYFISGRVSEGRKLGRTIGFPTANLIPVPEKLMPPYGVYSSLVTLGDNIYKSITDIGTKPTVNGGGCGVETYVIGYEGNLYGQEIKVELLHMMRLEQKFDSLEALQNQLEADVKERMTYEK